MKLRPCGDVLLVEPDDPEPEVVEFALDDAEAREEVQAEGGFFGLLKRDTRITVHKGEGLADAIERAERAAFCNFKITRGKGI